MTINEKLSLLHIKEGVSAADLYRTEKVAYGYCYIDKDLTKRKRRDYRRKRALVYVAVSRRPTGICRTETADMSLHWTAYICMAQRRMHRFWS